MVQGEPGHRGNVEAALRAISRHICAASTGFVRNGRLSFSNIISVVHAWRRNSASDHRSRHPGKTVPHTPFASRVRTSHERHPSNSSDPWSPVAPKFGPRMSALRRCSGRIRCWSASARTHRTEQYYCSVTAQRIALDYVGCSDPVPGPLAHPVARRCSRKSGQSCWIGLGVGRLQRLLWVPGTRTLVRPDTVDADAGNPNANCTACTTVRDVAPILW